MVYQGDKRFQEAVTVFAQGGNSCTKFEDLEEIGLQHEKGIVNLAGTRVIARLILDEAFE